MTTEDKIVAAIDRNTKSSDRLYEALLRVVMQLIWISVYLLLLCFPVACIGLNIAKAATLLPPLPEPAPLQYWHTVDIPRDGGVYSLEVFAPALPRIEFQPQIVDIGDPPAPPVHVPEPGTLWVAGIAIGVILWVWVARREERKWKKIEEDQDRRFNQICARVDKFRIALVHISENSGCLDSQCVARKALEE